MNIIDNLLTPNKYSRPGTKLTKVTKIALHYVGNAGSTASGNRNYFESLKVKQSTYASSHYIIGLDGEIIRCVPESEIAYCTNEANSYSISIENCHPLADGKFNDKTYKSLIELCADLCKRYNLNPLTDLIRHYDVTKKLCPLYYVNNPAAWEQLKKDVKNKMAPPVPQPTPTYKISESNLTAMIDAGVITSPNYWRNINLQYLNELLANAAKKGVLDKRINNGIKDIDNAFDVLIDAGIIASPTYWKNLIKANTVQYLDGLLINIANKSRIILEKIIHAEAQGEDEKGQILVGCVIQNRVKDKNFPNSIYDVVFQNNQFSPISNGAYSKANPSASVKTAVDKLLSGTDYSQGATFFRTIKGAEGSWHELNLTKIFDYGCHSFYK